MEYTVVSVLDVNGQVISQQTLDDDQTFSLTGLNQNQNYILSASHSEYGTVEKEFSISSMVHVEDIEYDLSVMSSENEKSQFPDTFSLNQNYPNPFNPTTQITYVLPEESSVSVIVYDLMGKEVKSLINKIQPKGNYSLKWDATDELGERISAGMYIYTIRAGQFTSTKKMVLLK